MITLISPRGQEFPARQIAGRADDDKNMGFNLLLRHSRGPLVAGCYCSNFNHATITMPAYRTATGTESTMVRGRRKESA